jgi:hypothetical protein
MVLLVLQKFVLSNFVRWTLLSSVLGLFVEGMKGACFLGQKIMLVKISSTNLRFPLALAGFRARTRWKYRGQVV